VDEMAGLEWYDRNGTQTNTFLEGFGVLNDLAISPDERYILLGANAADDPENGDIWVVDTERETRTRLTFSPDYDDDPVWSPDGQKLVYSSAGDLFLTSADGQAEPVPIYSSDNDLIPCAWSPDGRHLIFAEAVGDQRDLMMLDLENPSGPAPFRSTPFDEIAAQFSPDGRWVVYTGNQSGRYDVYLERFPDGGGRKQVSSEGGHSPKWSRSGEIFFADGGGWMTSVSVTWSGDEPVLGDPIQLFPTGLRRPWPYPDYNVTHDGQRFLLKSALNRSTQINLILNWNSTEGE
jgi:serine/threonine-protein kinase